MSEIDKEIFEKEEISDDFIDWEGLKAFEENLPPPTGKSIFEHVKGGIFNRIVLAYSVTIIADQLTKAANLSSPIKPGTLRTWLYRKRISCRDARNSALQSSYLKSDSLQKANDLDEKMEDKTPSTDSRFARQSALGATLRTTMEKKLNSKWIRNDASTTSQL